MDTSPYINLWGLRRSKKEQLDISQQTGCWSLLFCTSHLELKRTELGRMVRSCVVVYCPCVVMYCSYVVAYCPCVVVCRTRRTPIGTLHRAIYFYSLADACEDDCAACMQPAVIDACVGGAMSTHGYQRWNPTAWFLRVSCVGVEWWRIEDDVLPGRSEQCSSSNCCWGGHPLVQWVLHYVQSGVPSKQRVILPNCQPCDMSGKQKIAHQKFAFLLKFTRK